MRRKAPGRIDAAVRSRILALRTEGRRAPDIATACNLSNGAVYAVLADLRNLGIAVPKVRRAERPAREPSGWRITEDQALDWLAQRRAGAGLKAIAEAAGRTKQTVHNVLKRLQRQGHDVPRARIGRPPGYTPAGGATNGAAPVQGIFSRANHAERLDRAAAAWAQGLSLDEIARSIGCGRKVVAGMARGYPERFPPRGAPLSARVVAGMARVQQRLQREADRLNEHWATRGVRANARVENFQLVSDLGQHFARRRAG